MTSTCPWAQAVQLPHLALASRALSCRWLKETTTAGQTMHFRPVFSVLALARARDTSILRFRIALPLVIPAPPVNGLGLVAR